MSDSTETTPFHSDTKSQRKSRGLPAHLTPGNPGNSGGKPGRSGRPPEAFKAFLARLRSDPKIQDALERALSDPSCRGFSSALKVLTEYDLDKPAEKKEIQLPGTVEVRVVREGRRVTAG